MPPRKSKKKQTRLAFAAATASPSADVSPEQANRYATLKYENPSLGTYRPPKSLKFKSEPSPETEQPKLPTKTRSNDKPPKDKSENEPLHRPILLASHKEMQAAPPDNLEVVVLSPPRPRTTLKRKAASSPIDSSDSDEPVASSVTKRRRSTRGGHFSSSPVLLSDDDSNESVAPSTVKRRRLSRPAAVNESDDDSDEPLASSPVKRLRRGQEKETSPSPHTPRQISKQARLDIAEDLEDLQDSVVKKSRTRGRNVESARDKRMKHLEALRRRRAGVKDEDEDEEDDDDDEDEYDSDVQEIARPGSGAGPSSRGLRRHHDDDSDVESAIDPNENLDRYEDDFVLEDEHEFGVPTEEIPFEFTRHAYKQPKEYFRDVIGWMVQNKLNPAFPRSDDMYKMAFMKLEDEVKGRAGSQLISSVWNPSFVYALQARPHIEIAAFLTEENHPCDACRRSGHPASSDIKLYGKAYSLRTLEPLEDDNDDSDDSDDREGSSNEDDGKERDRDGHVIPPENVRYFLGKQCKARAQLAHTLTHWRYHLNEWVIDFLERTGHMESDEILRRNDMSVKRRTRNANDVLDSMTGSGEVDKLWRDFHINLKSAREKEFYDVAFLLQTFSGA
ncbi:protein of unknown function DUF4211 [Penicillium griseofulvum]|uniref:DUF4211 domain-containing protein n=1 Tax=Penicillium patulum TaxID=5078 RepID=A0A135LJ61_PENPA|nr:protein of unknown function DUF4211 [Penicillium griseofulvum]KXG49003.1 protein of unknown function DUF4211 [Penicillium griseofulvum]